MAKIIPSDGVLVERAQRAVTAELEKKRALKNPIARFDPKDGNVYLVYGNGKKELVGKAMRRGRYNERCK